MILASLSHIVLNYTVPVNMSNYYGMTKNNRYQIN